MAQSDAEQGNENEAPENGLTVVPEANEEEPVTEAVSAPAAAELPGGKQQGRLKRAWHALTATPQRAVLSALAGIVLVAVVIGLTPVKYPLLGWLIKANVDVRVSDGSTRQLLPGAQVQLGSASATTDKTGVAHFASVHPGPTKIQVTKSAYDGWTTNSTIGFGDNAAIDARLTSTGIHVSLKLTNYVTDKPVKGARVQVGDADVVSGEDGTVIASVSPSETSAAPATAKVTVDGFNDLSLSLTLKDGAAPVTAKLVPAGSAYFLSNRSGRVDMYAANLDGSNSRVVLAGTGNEDGSTGILPNVYDQSVVALISSRAGQRTGGNLVEDLYVFHTDTGTLTLVDSGVSFGNYRTWLGKSLVYIKYSGGGNHATIQSYTPSSGKNTTVVACTGDGACPTPLYSTDNLFIYALSGAPTGSSSNGLYAVKSGDTTSKSISSTPASQTLRQVKNTLLLQYYSYSPVTGDSNVWQSLDLGSTKVATLANGPSSSDSRTYIDSPGDKYSVSVDNRDGQTDLYVTDQSGGNERALTSTGKVDQFVQWFGDDYVVYSSANQLFVVGIAGGQPQKITNFYSGSVRVYGGGYNPAYY